MGCFSSSQQDSKSSSSSYLPEQADWLKKALTEYGPQLGQNNNVYEGDRVADFTNLQKNVLSGISNYLPTYSMPTSVGTPMFKETGNTIADLLAGNTGAKKITDTQRDDYFQKSTYEPTMRMLKDDILPTVDEGYAGGNFFGSARGKARDAASTDAANYLTQSKSNLDWNVLQNNQNIDTANADRALSTLYPAMQYGQMPAQETFNNLKIAATKVQGMKDLFGFGQAEQTQQQQEITAAIAKFAEEQQITDPENLAVLMSLLGMNFSSSSGSGSSSGPGLGYSWVSNLMKSKPE